jgi:hypothetical protein
MLASKRGGLLLVTIIHVIYIWTAEIVQKIGTLENKHQHHHLKLMCGMYMKWWLIGHREQLMHLKEGILISENASNSTCTCVEIFIMCAKRESMKFLMI